MKKLSILLSIFILAIGIYAQPKIATNEKIFDFGNIRQGEVVAHDFVVKNVGDEDLNITKVRASCGCTAAAPDKDILAPGDSATIKVEFNSKGRSGVQKKYVYVFSNDPKQKQIRLAFTTKILVGDELDAKEVKQPKLAVSDKKVDFGNVVAGETKSAELNIINKGKSELIVKDIRTTCDCITATLSSKKLSPGEVAFLNIMFDSNRRMGEVTRTVTLVTNETHHNETSILLTANVTKGEKS